MSERLGTLNHSKRIYVVHPYTLDRLNVLHEWLEAGAEYWRLVGQIKASEALETQWRAVVNPHTEHIVIDETDRADDCALAQFLRVRLAEHPEQRFLLLGRVIPMCILQSELAESVQVFPHDPSELMVDYSQVLPNYGKGQHLLEVYALNGGQVVLNGTTIRSWDGVLPRLLFYFLVDRGIATRDDIFHNFWRDVDIPEATNVFHVTKRKLNEMLGIELMIYDGGFYRFSPNIELRYDVLAFMNKVQEGDLADDDTQASASLETALRLYRGDFLNAYELEWIRQRRYELRQSYCEALGHLGRVRERQERLTEAIGYYLQGLRLGDKESNLRRVMSLYERLGDEQGAKNVQKMYALS